MFEDQVQQCAQEARNKLRALRIRVPRTCIHVASWSPMAGYCAGVIRVPVWQGVRAYVDRAGFIRTFIHEYGHAYLMTYWDRLIRAGADTTFGDFNRPYPTKATLLRCRFDPRAPEGYVSAYAAAHPLEDFAETFAWVVRYRMKPARVDNEVLQAKLDFMRRVVRR